MLNNNTAHSKPLSGNVFPNSAIIGYATESALLIISALCPLNWHGTLFSEYILQTGRDPRVLNNNTAHLEPLSLSGNLLPNFAIIGYATKLAWYFLQ